MKILKIAVLALSAILVNTSCSSDFVEREFYQSVEQAPLSSEIEVESFVKGIYSSMRSSSYLGRNYILYSEIRSDEMYSRERQGLTSVYRYTMTSTDGTARSTYSTIYEAIAKANIVINTDINKIPSSDHSKVNFHKGQALVLRGLLAFDLLKLYGQKYSGGELGVVYPLEYNPKARQARGTIVENEAQIEKDLVEGLALMEANAAYNPATKTELSINAVKGFMSRYFLYKEDWQKVSDLVKEIYGAYSVVAKDAYLTSWTLSDASPNSVFELAVGQGGNLGTSSLYQMYHTDGYADVPIVSRVYTRTSYYPDTTDVRLEQFSRSGSRYYLTGKYTERNANIKLLRYEEILLNGAEAELQLGNTETALTYFNEIRTNRGSSTRTSLRLSHIKNERVAELVGEGFRYWDLLRWGDISSLSYQLYGGAFNNDKNLLVFPIPAAETNLEGSLVVSNPGYDN